LYFINSLIYYHRQIHLFDPYLQCPSTRFHEPINKEDNTFRILCLGGSTTMCIDLSKQERYPEALQVILQKHYLSAKLEVLNGGMYWYTTKHSLINYVSYCQYWKPDLVIVMHAINDLYRSFSPPRFAIGEYNELWTHFYGASINAAKPPAFEHYLYSQLRGMLYSELSFKRRFTDILYFKSKFIEVDYPLEKYLSIGAFEKHLRGIVKYVRTDKSNILLVTQPSLYKEIMNEKELKTLWTGKTFCYTQRNLMQIEYPSHESLYKAMKMFNHVVKKVALSENVIFTDAANQMPKNLQNFKDDCHLTAPGAKFLAKIISEAIIDSEIIDKKTKLEIVRETD